MVSHGETLLPTVPKGYEDCQPQYTVVEERHPNVFSEQVALSTLMMLGAPPVLVTSKCLQALQDKDMTSHLYSTPSSFFHPPPKLQTKAVAYVHVLPSTVSVLVQTC